MIKISDCTFNLNYTNEFYFWSKCCILFSCIQILLVYCKRGIKESGFFSDTSVILWVECAPRDFNHRGTLMSLTLSKTFSKFNQTYFINSIWFNYLISSEITLSPTKTPLKRLLWGSFLDWVFWGCKRNTIFKAFLT